jgi:hypothetical protein
MDTGPELRQAWVRKLRFTRAFIKVSDGIRTRDRRDHNPELYQLSYAHRGSL